MNCPVCGSEGKMQSLDHLRNRDLWIEQDFIPLDGKVGFCVCGACGFLTYERQKTEEQLKEFYRTDYRSVCSAGNIVTCNRKNLYHARFLADWIGVGSQKRSVLDFGCAQGAMLAMLRDRFGFDNTDLDGTEWTKGFRAYGNDELGVNITEDPDESKRYDLITMYHVLEHCYDPRKTLLQLKGMLKEGGKMYLSIPTWLDRLEISDGTRADNWEVLFHLNHINCFSEISFRNLLGTCGLSIVKEDRSIYGYTVLVEPGAEKSITLENAGAIVKVLELQKQAISFLKDPKTGISQPGEAIGAWENFPDAHISLAYFKENMRSEELQKRILDKAIKTCPGSDKLVRQRAMVELQWAENKMAGQPRYNNGVKRYEQLMKEADALKPNSENDLHFLAVVEYLYKDNAAEACRLWKEAARINPVKFGEFWTYIGAARAKAKLPTKQGDGTGQVDQEATNAVSMVLIPELEPMRLNMGVKP